MAEIQIDSNGNKVVVIQDILFMNKQNIDWKSVEAYLERYIGEIVTIVETKDIVYVGKKFPDEYASSKYTGKLKGALAKAKANAVQGIEGMLKISILKEKKNNYKEKHEIDAANGWYYFTTRFALPVYDNEVRTEKYNVYQGRFVINHASNGKLYLYDLVDIKKEASTLLKTKK